MNPGPPVNYRVSQSQLTAEQFRQLMALAQSQGRRQLVLRAARYVIDELAYDPLKFGESRGHLPHLQLELRIAFAPPLYVADGEEIVFELEPIDCVSVRFAAKPAA